MRVTFHLGSLAMLALMLGCAQPRPAYVPSSAPLPPDDAPTAAARAGIEARLAALANLTVEYAAQVENITNPTVDMKVPMGVWKKSRDVFRYYHGSTRFDLMDLAVAMPPFDGTLHELHPASATVATFPRVRVGERAETFTTSMSDLSFARILLVFEDEALGLRALDAKEWNMPESVARMQLRAGEQGRVEGVVREHPAVRYIFDPARGYALERVVAQGEAGRHTIVAEDFRPVGALQLPYRLTKLIEWKPGGATAYTPTQRSTATVTRYLLDDPKNRDLSLFARPVPR
jgi:hypothetical protein